MRNFIFNLLIFLLIVFLYFSLVFAYNYRNENHPNIKKSNIIFIGDSHIKCHINPDSFPNAENYGASADLIIGLKWKIDKLIKNNNKIDTIIIGISYNNFTEFYPDFFIHHSGAHRNLMRYLLISNGYLFFENTKLIAVLWSKIKKPTLELPYLEYFSERIGIINDSANSAIYRHFNSQTKYNHEIQYEIYKIIKSCEDNNITSLLS